jgi:tRNA pseudouridine38-40 synthase
MTRMNWRLTLSYDGTDFHGWQVQQNDLTTPTIQGMLASAIAAVTGERVLPQGSGRTDAGVHALGQVASFPLAAPIPPQNFQRALNRFLPAAIRVVAAEPAPPDFHARHSAVGKIYRYRIFHGEVCSPFLARYVSQSRGPLDLAAMQAAAQAIMGEHDFTSFAASDPDRTIRVQQKTSSSDPMQLNIRRIDSSQWSHSSPARLSSNNGVAEEDLAADRADIPMYTYFVRGNGFLHHMVRNLVGTFLDVGRGRIEQAAIAEILSGRDRALAGPTAPANGLCLIKVLY